MRLSRSALVLVLLAAPLGAEQGEAVILPRWLLGKWCPVLPPGDMAAFGPVPAERVVEVEPGVRIAPNYFGPGEGCITWTVEGAGLMHGSQRFYYSGRSESPSVAKIKADGGRLRYESWGAWDTRTKLRRFARFREVSSGPDEVVFHTARGWFRIRREGNILAYEWIDEASGDVRQSRYALNPPEQIGPFEHVRIPRPR
jgi:hypothetical protein